MAKSTTATEITQPIARLAGSTWRKRSGVPTAGSHQVRRPAISSQA
jgi:hypothetical protein